MHDIYDTSCSIKSKNYAQPFLKSRESQEIQSKWFGIPKSSFTHIQDKTLVTKQNLSSSFPALVENC